MSLSSVTTAPKGKAFAKLGLSFSDLLNTVLTATKGKLEATAYEFFWDHVSNFQDKRKRVSGSSDFVIAMINHLTKTVKKKDKGSDRELQSIVNTIAFVVLTYPIAENQQAVFEALKKLQTQHQAAGRPLPSIDEVARIVTKTLEGSLTVDGLLISASTIYTTEELSQFANYLELPAFDGLTVCGGEYMKVFSNLRDSILLTADTETMSNNILYIINSILANMRTLSKTYKISPELSSVQLLAYMHLMKVFLNHVRFVFLMRN